MGGKEPDETPLDDAPLNEAPLDEDGLIRRYFAPLATHPGALALTDDAATYAVPQGRELVLTVDAVVAGVHFFPGDPADLMARKALRVNVSDLVAKGATPTGYLLTLVLGDGWSRDWVERFAEGLAADQAAYGMTLLGGDTVRSDGPTCVSITALGTVPTGEAPRRNAATAGQFLYVTGTIGDSALGLTLRRDPALAERWGLSGEERDHLLGRYLLPDPKPAAAPLVLRFAHASMDVSDGLAIDTSRLCSASRVSAVIEAEQVPLSPAAARALAADPAVLETLLTGGDDYEVLFSADAASDGALRAAFAASGVPVACIGRLTAAQDAAVAIRHHRQPLPLRRLGFRHF